MKYIDELNTVQKLLEGCSDKDKEVDESCGDEHEEELEEGAFKDPHGRRADIERRLGQIGDMVHKQISMTDSELEDSGTKINIITALTELENLVGSIENQVSKIVRGIEYFPKVEDTLMDPDDDGSFPGSDSRLEEE